MDRERRGVPLDRPVGIIHSEVTLLTEPKSSIMIPELQRGND
jgi:hypothetical protein